MSTLKTYISVDCIPADNKENIKENIKIALELDNEKLCIEIVNEIDDSDVVLLWHSQKKLLNILSNQISIKKSSKDIDFKSFAFLPQEFQDEHKFKPIIHLTNIQIISNTDNCNEREIIDNRRSKLKWSRHISRMDSSIWHYYYSIEEHSKNPQKFSQIISEIEQNYFGGEKNLSKNKYMFNRYKLSVSEEYEEFYTRLSMSSYIFCMNGGHSANVSPFLFHSESYMKSQLEVASPQENILHSQDWRILLVDDHATTNMSCSKEIGVKLNKLDIIKEDLRRIGFTIEDKRVKANNHYIEFDCVSSVDDAYKRLEKRNDLILLDYKLAENIDKGRIEYGYELLKKIKENQEGKYKEETGREIQLEPGPNETFYFMFISAYTTAVQERLQMEGFYVSKDYWFIGRGACPTNTPYLFLYSLKRMMDIRYDKLTKHSKQLFIDLGESDIKDKEKGLYASMTMFLTKLFEKDNERNNCVKGFNAFLNLRRVYDIIKNDVKYKNKSTEIDNERSSPLILSLFKDEQYCSNSFWEHLQNLVYLTAFGTIRQWPEMWEDYTFIKGKLEKAEKKILETSTEFENDKKIVKEQKPSILIRNYILSLKSIIS